MVGAAKNKNYGNEYDKTRGELLPYKISYGSTATFQKRNKVDGFFLQVRCKRYLDVFETRSKRNDC